MTKLLVIDTETGGTDPSVHSILSVAGVVWEDGISKADFEYFIAEPVISVIPRALEINRIDLAKHGERAVTPEVAVHQLTEFISNHFGGAGKVTVVGHNVHFDIAFIKRLFRLGGLEFERWFSHRLLDTASILRYLELAGAVPITSASSTSAFSYFGIDVSEGERHTAIGDARATAALLNKLLEVTRSVSAAKLVAE